MDWIEKMITQKMRNTLHPLTQKRQYLTGAIIKSLSVLALTTGYATIVYSMEPMSTNNSKMSDSELREQQNEAFQESLSKDIEKELFKMQKVLQDEKSDGILKNLISLNDEIDQLETEIQKHSDYLTQVGGRNPKILEKIEIANTHLKELIGQRIDFLNLNNLALTSLINGMVVNLDRLMKCAKNNNCDKRILDIYLNLQAELNQIAKHLPLTESLQDVSSEINSDGPSDFQAADSDVVIEPLDNNYDDLEDIHKTIGTKISDKLCGMTYCRDGKMIPVKGEQFNLIKELFGEIDQIEDDYINYINLINDAIEETLLSEIKTMRRGLDLFSNLTGDPAVDDSLDNLMQRFLGVDRNTICSSTCSKSTKLETLIHDKTFRHKLLKSYLDKYISHRKNEESKMVVLKQNFTEKSLKPNADRAHSSLLDLLAQDFLRENRVIGPDIDPQIFKYLNFGDYLILLQLNKTFCSSFSNLNQFPFGSTLLCDYTKRSISFPIEKIDSDIEQLKKKHQNEIDSYKNSYWGVKSLLPFAFEPDHKEHESEVRGKIIDREIEESRVQKFEFQPLSVSLLKKAADHINADGEAIILYINYLGCKNKHPETIDYFDKLFTIKDEKTLNSHLDKINSLTRQRAFWCYYKNCQNIPSWKIILLGQSIVKGKTFLIGEEQKIMDAMEEIRFGRDIYKPKENCSIM